MRLKMMTAVVAMGLCTGALTAQGPAPKEPSLGKVGTQASPAKAIDIMLSDFEQQVLGVAKEMPADKYDFSPASKGISGGKFDGVRTFADQAKHLAQANYFFYARVGGMEPDVDVRAIGNLKSKDEIVAALAASFAFAHKAIATITAENAFTVINGADGYDTRASTATFGVAHGYDHYGQMVEYLRMNGMVPPGSK